MWVSNLNGSDRSQRCFKWATRPSVFSDTQNKRWVGGDAVVMRARVRWAVGVVRPAVALRPEA
jgi:hypothetical protein